MHCPASNNDMQGVSLSLKYINLSFLEKQLSLCQLYDI